MDGYESVKDIFSFFFNFLIFMNGLTSTLFRSLQMSSLFPYTIILVLPTSNCAVVAVSIKFFSQKVSVYVSPIQILTKGKLVAPVTPSRGQQCMYVRGIQKFFFF